LLGRFWDWTRFYVPDLFCVFRNGAIARELSRARDIQDRPARPFVAIGIQCAELFVGLKIGPQICQVHIVIAVLQQHVSQGFEDTGFVAAEVVGEDQVERLTNLRLVFVMPVRVVPSRGRRGGEWSNGRYWDPVGLCRV